MSFLELGLDPALDAALDADEIRSPTPVQRVTVPALLGGAHIVAVARTGSGKTLAYALPLLQRLRAAEDADGMVTERGRPRAIVLTGTRELVEQTLKVLKRCAHPVRQRVRGVGGGMNERLVATQLSEPCDVLVANPPRLAQLVRAGTVRLDDVRVFVVDEADTLLAPGQRREVEDLLGRLRGAQIAYFSATLPEPIRAWLLARPERPTLLLSKDAHTAPTRVHVTNLDVKPAERIDAVSDALVEAGADERGILFCNRRETADEIGQVLAERGHDVVVVHGGQLPEERRKALGAFRKGKGRLLVTTELGGRGLHIDGLAFVVNFELPEKPSEYLHRIGRVGRQGAKGRVINLVTAADARLLTEVKRLAQGGALDTGEALRTVHVRRAPQPERKRRKPDARGKAEGKGGGEAGAKPLGKTAGKGSGRPPRGGKKGR